MKELPHSKINKIIQIASEKIGDALGDTELQYEAPLLLQARNIIRNLGVLRLPDFPGLILSSFFLRIWRFLRLRETFFR